MDEFPARGFTDELRHGLIAQEVEQVLPDVVVSDDAGFKSIRYNEIIPVLIEAVKAQQKIIAEQSARLANIEKLLKIE